MSADYETNIKITQIAESKHLLVTYFGPLEENVRKKYMKFMIYLNESMGSGRHRIYDHRLSYGGRPDIQLVQIRMCMYFFYAITSRILPLLFNPLYTNWLFNLV